MSLAISIALIISIPLFEAQYTCHQRNGYYFDNFRFSTVWTNGVLGYEYFPDVTATHDFQIVSHDTSHLFIDGAYVINNTAFNPIYLNHVGASLQSFTTDLTFHDCYFITEISTWTTQPPSNAPSMSTSIHTQSASLTASISPTQSLSNVTPSIATTQHISPRKPQIDGPHSQIWLSHRVWNLESMNNKNIYLTALLTNWKQILNTNFIIDLCIILMLIARNISSWLLCALPFLCIVCDLNTSRHNKGFIKCKLSWLLWVQIIIFCGSIHTVSAQLMFNSWTTSTTNPTLPGPFYYAAAAYDNSSDTIHLVGGTTGNSGWYQRLSINETTSTITFWDTSWWPMFTRPFAAIGQAYVQRGDILWMIDPFTTNSLHTLNTWDMTNNNYVANAIPTGIGPNVRSHSCLASYQDYLIIIGALNTVPQIYSFATNSWLTNIQPLNTPFRPDLACVTVNDEIYVIGGLTSDNRATVEYLDLSDIANIQNYNWTEMSQTIPQIVGQLSRHRAIIICDQIVVIGGQDDSVTGKISDITVIDPISKTMTLAGNLNRAVYGMAVVVTDDNIYAFSGIGMDSSDSYIRQYHALPACPTEPPSNAPSISPTQPPSNAPSISPTQPPSNAPSIAPSIAPTQPPSITPSIAPTQPPSIAPTQPPSIAPSIAPTQPPSIAPSNAPSIAPSISPTQPPSLVPTSPPTNSPSFTPSTPPTNAPIDSSDEIDDSHSIEEYDEEDNPSDDNNDSHYGEESSSSNTKPAPTPTLKPNSPTPIKNQRKHASSSDDTSNALIIESDTHDEMFNMNDLVENDTIYDEAWFEWIIWTIVILICGITATIIYCCYKYSHTHQMNKQRMDSIPSTRIHIDLA